MASIGSIALAVTASTAGLEASLHKGQGLIKTFAAGAVGALSKLSGVGGAIAGVTSIGGIKDLIKNSFEGIVATTKLADRLDISTESLVGFQKAAKATGVDAEAVNTGMLRMQRVLGAASQGSKEAQFAVEQLGLNFEDIITMKPDQAFLEIADRIKGLGSQYEKAKGAQDLFGRGGVQLIGVLSKGRAGLEEMIHKAKGTGEAFSHDAGKSVLEANKAIYGLKATISGIGNTIAITLAPAIKAVATAFQYVIGFVKSFVSVVTSDFKGVIGAVLVAAVAFKALSYIPSVLSAISMGVKLLLGVFSFNPVILAIIGVVGALSAMGVTFEDVKAVASAAAAYLTPVWDGIVSVWNAAVGAFGEMWSEVSGAVMGEVQLVVDTVGAWWFGLMDNLGLNFDAMRNAVMNGLYTIEFGFKNWRKVLELAAVGAIYGIVKFANQVVYFFTTVIPETLAYLGRNWRDVFTDLWNWTATVFTNLTNNIVAIFKNLPGLLTGAVSWSDVWTPLTEGFTSALKESLEIPEREIGQLEKSLGNDLDALSTSLKTKLGDFIAQKQAALQTAQGVKPSELGPAAAAKAMGLAGKGGKQNEIKGFQGIEDFSRKIQESISGGDSQKKMLDLAGQSLEVQERIADGIEDLELGLAP